ncbi:Insulin-like growth factor binding protein, N-terminal [Pseudocohnilembus persalinus]|uniref:Insulin-like growth factor binding protein, N-terminal n=1 Tax=Pseudocohnilembus persalinus TaxID=266149 RepID=A0A0V0QAL0_PSEPJ|nr:Insulin-like growth factor binding protein, N-terminal [Pseudocohnilembus persalinus]|eukprot:KRW99232.1 Insulin-like growth factor binding protein, N-terminal [Pseudocohnilembus persalinus]
MNRFAKKINKVILFCWIIVIFNPVQGIQLDTTQWQEIDITDDFTNQNFKQYSQQSRLCDSQQISQTKYANLIRSESVYSGQILIQVLDEYGNQQCGKTISVEYQLKYSLTNTNVEGEFFLAYTSGVIGNFKVFFGFINESCNFSRGFLAPAQVITPDDFTSTGFYNLLAKTGKDHVYVVSQTYSSPYYLYLMILDISDTITYNIKNHVKLGTTDFRQNLFSIQVFSDDYAVVFARDNNDELQKITIDSDGNDVWDMAENQGIFLDFNYIYNYIQNKAIQIQNTNKYSIVTGDYKYDIFTIYTFQYNGNGQVQDICLKSYKDQFKIGVNKFFQSLEFGVINQDFLWIKGDNTNDSYRSVIFFANPLDCQVYRNPDDDSIYQYKLENFSQSHIFHTYYSNQTVSLIVSSSRINVSSNQSVQAIRINIGENCPKYCVTCKDFENCNSCVSANVQRNPYNQCQCPDRYYQDQSSDDCLQCPQYCKKCSDSENCQSCISSDGDRDVSNLCVCKDGYFQDTQSENCISCPNYCQTCSDSENCQSCILSEGDRDLSNYCICNDGYYQDTGSDDCLECPKYCSKCSDSENCQSCISTYGERDESNLCQCKNGYYQDTISDNCIECPQYCQTCSDQENCQSCIISNGERDEYNLCQCKDGYYQDTDSDNCIECSQYCQTCLDSQNCLSCISSAGERDESNLCQCKDGYYQDTQSDNCLECPQYCSKCSDSENCLTCIISMVIIKIPKVITVSCPQYCSKCSDLENCQSCIISNGERDESNLCQCKDGYYQDINSDNCIECPQYCSKCSDSQNCLSCISSNGERDESNLCQCKDGYYQDTQSDNCIECPQYCSKCSDSQNCLSCIVSNGERNQSNLCQCKDGYYQDTDSDNCIECPYYCQTCSDSENCQSCISSVGERDESNLCQCKDGYYQDTQSDNCIECPQYCSKCSDSENCLSCISSYGERDESNLCLCKDGYYQDGESYNCFECSEYCTTCSDQYTCDSCPFPSKLRDKDSKCSCKRGYYQDIEKDTCLPCSPECDKCLSQNQCETCLNKNFIGPNCNFSINEYFIDEKNKIKKCHQKCVGCDQESTKCIKCQEGNRQDVSNNCDCLPGYHDNMGMYKNCIKCPRFCKNCINENFCTDCEQGYFLNDYTHQCGKCERGQIWNQHTKQCQECFYYKNQCIFYCPDNTVEGKYNMCLEKVYKEQKSNEKWLIYFGIGFIIQLIIFGIILEWKIKKIIKYVTEEHQNNIKNEYEQLVDVEYQKAKEGNQQQQKNKIELFDQLLRRDIFKYEQKIESIFKKMQEHSNINSEITKPKQEVSQLITQQSILEQIYKEFIKEHGYQNKKKVDQKQEQHENA